MPEKKSKTDSGIANIEVIGGVIKVKVRMDVTKKDAERAFGQLLDKIRMQKKVGEPALILTDMTDVTRLSFASRRRLLKLYSLKPSKMAFYGEIFRVELLMGCICKLVSFVRFGVFKTEIEAKKYLGVS